MYFVPLSQLESVELLVHALRAAAGEADCQQCPARRVCMKQCLTIADAVQGMINNGTLPTLDSDSEPEVQAPFHHEAPPAPDSAPTQTLSPAPSLAPGGQAEQDCSSINSKKTVAKKSPKKSHLHVVK